MKANSRRFLACMFCDKGQPPTREHIFGSSISKQFDPVLMAVYKTQIRPKIDPRFMDRTSRKKYVRSAGDHALAITSFSMCEECNGLNGKEISQISQTVAQIFRGKLPSIPKNSNKLVLRYFQRIGLLVDLETSAFDEETMTQDFRDGSPHHVGIPIASASQRKSFIEGDVLGNVSVHLSRCDKQSGKYYPMMVGRSGLSPEQPTAKRFLFSIDRLAVMVTVGDPVYDLTGKMILLERSDSYISIPSRPFLSWDELKRNISPITINLDGSSSIEYLP